MATIKFGGQILGKTRDGTHQAGAGWGLTFPHLVVQGEVTAFFVADLGAVVRKHFCFLKCLPRVRPFYAVKCNSSLGVLKVLAELGLGFSCANKVSPCPHRHTDPHCLLSAHTAGPLWVGPGEAGVTLEEALREKGGKNKLGICQH